MVYTPPQSDVMLAPFAQDAEEGTIGAVLTSGLHIFSDVAAFLNAEDFYLTRHQRIWETFVRLEKDKSILDLLTISEDLRQRDLLEEIGGYAYLIHLVNNTPNSMHAEVYGQIVKRTATRRKLLVAADKIREAAVNENKHIHNVLADAEKAMYDATHGHVERRPEPVKSSSGRVWEAMTRLYAGEDAGVGLKTDFQNIDALLNGLEPDELGILAARPGMGKTSLLLCMLLNIALRGEPVGMFTMEMSADRLTSRLYALLSGVSTTKQKTRGACTPDDVKALRKAKETIDSLPLYIVDEPSPTPRQVMTSAQRLVRIEGAKAIFIDGLYRMSPDYDLKGDETAAYGQNAKALKTMNQYLRTPFVVTHQLNRSLESRNDKRPMLSDLRQSGRIEEEADIVMFLYRDGVYNESADPHSAEFIVAKNRDGRIGTVPLYFEPSLTQFKDGEVTKWTLER